MDPDGWIPFDGMLIPPGLLGASASLSDAAGFTSWRKEYRATQNHNDKLDLLAEIEIGHNLKRQGCALTLRPKTGMGRGPDLAVDLQSERLFYAEVKRVRFGFPDAEHQRLKSGLVTHLLQIDSPFGFDLCFYRRLTTADEASLLPKMVGFYKSVCQRLSPDSSFVPGDDREFLLDPLEESASLPPDDGDLNELPRLGKLIVSRVNDEGPPIRYFRGGDVFNIYLGNEAAKLRDDLFDGDRCKYAQLSAGASGVIIVKVDSDSHKAEDLFAAFSKAKQLHEYPNLSAVGLLSRWRKQDGRTSSEIFVNKRATFPLRKAKTITSPFVRIRFVDS